jgi:hypothetical protein
MWGRTEQGFYLPTFEMSSKASRHGSHRVVILNFLTFLTPSLRLLSYLALHLSSRCSLAHDTVSLETWCRRDVSIRQHTSNTSVCIRQHTPAYVEYERLAVAQLSASRSSGRELKPAVALTKAAAQREPLFWM